MKTALKLFIVLAILITMTPAAYAADAIGTLSSLEGSIYKLEQETRTTLKQGDDIFLNDELETDANSFAKISFIDETSIDLGEKTVLEIDDFVYDPKNNNENTAEFTITKGPFRYISGLIAKKEDPDVKINLDFGNIGIRGTKVWRDLINHENDKPMCRIYVEDGEADVFNDSGKVTLGHEDGTKIKGKTNAPTAPKKWAEAAIKDIKSKIRD